MSISITRRFLSALSNICQNKPPSLVSKRILAVTHVRFWILDRGSARRISGLFTSLIAAGYEIHVVHTDPLAEADHAAVKNLGIRSIISRPLLQNGTSTVVEGDDSILADLVEASYQLLKPSILLVEYARFANVTSRVGSNVIKVVDTHDVAHLMAESFEKNGEVVYFRFTKEEEADLLRSFDIVIAIQRDDAAVFAELLPDKKVVTCLPAISIPDVDDSVSSNDFKLLFIGCSSRPNVTGLSEFLNKCWPAILACYPNACLNVCGSVCQQFDSNEYPNVRFLGFVDSIDTVYNSAQIVISPIFYGGGMKIKCVEAMSYSKACVISQHSAVGMNDGEGVAFLVAQDINDFTSQVLCLLSDADRRTKIASAARQYAISHFSPEATIIPLLNALEIFELSVKGRR